MEIHHCSVALIKHELLTGNMLSSQFRRAGKDALITQLLHEIKAHLKADCIKAIICGVYTKFHDRDPSAPPHWGPKALRGRREGKKNTPTPKTEYHKPPQPRVCTPWSMSSVPGSGLTTLWGLCALCVLCALFGELRCCLPSSAAASFCIFCTIR